MIVTFHGFVTDSSVINDVCEPANLRTVVQLLLTVQLLLDEKPACLSEENISQMNAGYNNIMTVFKLLFQNKTNVVCENHDTHTSTWYHLKAFI